MGRPSKLAPLLQAIEASELARERVLVVLQTLTGQRSVQAGFEQLEISRTRFQDLRRRALEGALAAVEPRPRGRPPSPKPRKDSEVERLELEISVLEEELRFVRTCLEISESSIAEAVHRRVKHVLEQKRGRR